MTTKPRRPSMIQIDGVTETTPAPAPTSAPTPAPKLVETTPASPPSAVDRLEILDTYAGPDGLLPVFVAVSHDAVFAGQHIRVPVTDRIAGLIEIGFLEVDLPEPGTLP